ncbi:hypothetical protein [Oscillatoria salina]|uniref:hypothetical protein n=1 Tax=Oscillatoria salina TaxID=331517 RepID=UPI0013BB88D3|nr:hypothetical protein [Oscillatoria salina]MBZ8179998.1 hypothetical protein [Oscillatoria salina IIICB1]NET90339.1 hypothetical protein [Kamptonema sp. SIO1D9]
MMSSPGTQPKVELEKVVERIFLFRQITHLDRQLLKTALLSKNSFTPKDRMLIKKVVDGVREGKILVADS